MGEKTAWGGTSLAAQWLRLRASNARGTGLIPGQGTKIPHTTRGGRPTPPKKRKKPAWGGHGQNPGHGDPGTLSATLSPASIERVAQPRCGDPGSHGPKNNAIYLGSFSKELVLVMQMIIIATLDDLYIMW